jgi:hypothetical protein
MGNAASAGAGWGWQRGPEAANLFYYIYFDGGPGGQKGGGARVGRGRGGDRHNGFPPVGVVVRRITGGRVGKFPESSGKGWVRAQEGRDGGIAGRVLGFRQ